MKSCVIFDFDGVIAETEHLHFDGFNKAFRESSEQIGGPLAIAHADYMERYIPYGDHGAFFHMLTDNGRANHDALINALIDKKSVVMAELLSAVNETLPGVFAALDTLDSLGVPKAICSSARGAEIEQVLRACGIEQRFELVVAIDDVVEGKPNPECYTKAFDSLNARHGGALVRMSSIAIEDSIGGARAALDSGLRVLGVATNLPVVEISETTTYAVESLADVRDEDWRRWLNLA